MFYERTFEVCVLLRDAIHLERLGMHALHVLF